MNGVWKNVVVGLVYPAVLGAIAYNLFDKIVSQSAQIAPTAICIAVVIHYVVDYTYTATFTTKGNYNVLPAILDFFIIASLFVAGNSIWDSGLITSYFLFPAMVATKLWTLLWDKAVFERCQRFPWDLGFLITYLICALVFCPRIAIKSGTDALLKSSQLLYLLPSILIFLDAFFYALHIYKKSGHKLIRRGNP